MARRQSTSENNQELIFDYSCSICNADCESVDGLKKHLEELHDCSDMTVLEIESMAKIKSVSVEKGKFPSFTNNHV